jgi:hypothetical protein
VQYGFLQNIRGGVPGKDREILQRWANDSFIIRGEESQKLW